jgi:hypothetical protein
MSRQKNTAPSERSGSPGKTNGFLPSGKISMKRSKLHNSQTIGWLNKRHATTAREVYRFLPENLQTHFDLNNIFVKFDEDKSNKLDLKEFFVMMHEVNVSIDLKDLEDIYNVADLDHDNALDLKEFKNCTLSEFADEKFKIAMRNIKNRNEQKKRMSSRQN